jgi:hypothetical protein
MKCLFHIPLQEADMNRIPVVLVCLNLLILSCGQSKTDVQDERLSELAVKGRVVFAAKNCGSCHRLTGVRDHSVTDLSHPFFANDSMFVQTHLKFVERSEMTPVELTEGEVRAVAAYIAELHVASQPVVADSLIDAHCPVCRAPVSQRLAQEAGLTATFFEELYYFECKRCLGVFRHVPGAFVSRNKTGMTQKEDLRQ